MPKSSVDLSEFETLSRREPAQCVVARRSLALNDDDRDKLAAALDAVHISNNAIRSWLIAKGCAVGDGAVKKHRRKECCCAR